MSTTDYLEGAAWCLATFAPIGWGVWTILTRRLGHLVGTTRLVAAAVLGYSGVVVAYGIPLALGILGRGSVLVAALALGAGATAFTRNAAAGRQLPADPPPPGPGEANAGPVARWLAYGSLAIIAAWLLAAASSVVFSRIGGEDVATFDIPLLARWMQTGSMWGVYEFQNLFSHGSYPHNGELALLSVVQPWHSDFAVRLVPYLATALAAAATYALARELRASRELALSATALLLAVPIVAVSAISFVMPDGLMLMSVAGAALFLVRHARTSRTSDLVLAGLALGLAVGTKWYGLSTAVVIVLVWGAARLVARADLRQTLSGAGVLIGLAFAGGALWFARNLVEYGNPIFPQRIGLGGVTIFAAPDDPGRRAAGASIANRIGESTAFGNGLTHALWEAFAIAGVAIVAGVAATLVLAALRARRPSTEAVPRPVVAVALAAAGILLGYLFIPFTAGPVGSTALAFANSRYATPGLVLGVAACAAAAVTRPRLVLPLQVLVLIAVLYGIHYAPDASKARFALCLVVLLGAVAMRERIAEWWPPVRLARGMAGPIVAATIVAVVAGYALERRNTSSREIAADPTFAWVDASAPSGHRVAIAGSWTQTDAPPDLAMLGPRLGNTIGIISRSRDHLLRPFQSRTAWRAAVANGGYDLLITGTEEPRYLRWSEDLAGKPVAASPRFALFVLPPSGT